MLNISGLIDTIIREITINSSKQIVIREDAILDKLLAEKNRKSKQWGYFIQILLF